MATPGSACTIAASWATFWRMDWNEMSWEATTPPARRPLSCWGKKPFGITTKRYTVSAQVSAAMTRTVPG